MIQEIQFGIVDTRAPGDADAAAGNFEDITFMTNSHSDALVFFGATGDLAYKKIFPSLQSMVKRGNLNIPVIGVAKAGWNLDQLRTRAKDSLEKHGGLDPAAFEKLTRLLRYVDGDYQAPSRSKPFARTQGRTVSRSLPGHSPCSVRN